MTLSLSEKAWRVRRDMIRKLSICKCDWPEVKFRNGDGHKSDCPAHEQIVKPGAIR